MLHHYKKEFSMNYITTDYNLLRCN